MDTITRIVDGIRMIIADLGGNPDTGVAVIAVVLVLLILWVLLPIAVWVGLLATLLGTARIKWLTRRIEETNRRLDDLVAHNQTTAGRPAPRFTAPDDRPT